MPTTHSQKIMSKKIAIHIDAAFKHELLAKMGSGATMEFAIQEAFRLFSWAVAEHAAGRIVITTDAAGNNGARLCMPVLTRAASVGAKKAEAKDARKKAIAAAGDIFRGLFPRDME